MAPEDWQALDLEARQRREDEIDAFLAEWTSSSDANQLAAALQALGVVAATVADAADLLGNEQLAASGSSWSTRAPDAGSTRGFRSTSRTLRLPFDAPRRGSESTGARC